MADILIALGRIIFGLFFVIAGVRNFKGFATAAANKTSYGFVLPKPIIALGFAIQLLCGAALVANILVIPASLLLILFLILATSLYHNPLQYPAADRGLHIYLCLVNSAFIGYLLLIIGNAL